MTRGKCRCCGYFTEVDDSRLCHACIADICPAAEPDNEIHCEHGNRVQQMLTDLERKLVEAETAYHEQGRRAEKAERERDAFRADRSVMLAERQQLREILRVHLQQPSQDTVIAEYDPQPSLVDAARIIVRERDEALAANNTLEGELRSCLVSLAMKSPLAPNREQADYLAAQAIARLKGGK
jgi:vacuolar-type H+-ATPase subunit E/Vma4